MTRTDRANPSHHKPPKNANTATARHSQISRSLSKLLRHQAENEKVPISPAGWVKLEDLLSWRGLERIGKRITISEIFEVVEEDGRVGKGRFEVRYVDEVGEASSVHVEQEGENDRDLEEAEASIGADGAATGEMVEKTSNLSIESLQAQPTREVEPSSQIQIDSTSKNTHETQSALNNHLRNPDSLPSHYLIRAAQGHSIKSIQSTDLLIPITLSNPTSVPNTVVHGTFYGAWSSILSTGGLKAMGRNNVHFATGPSLDEVLSMTEDGNRAMSKKGQVDDVLSRNKVTSGMRWDAQILIFVDLKSCLEDVQTNGLDMTWWISGNGVVLTEGVVMRDEARRQEKAGQRQQQQETPQVQQDNVPEDENEPIIASKSAKARRARENLQAASQARPTQTQPQTQPPQPQELTIPENTDQPMLASASAKAHRARADLETRTQGAKQQEKIVPMKYWTKVVEIKNGVGVLWTQEEGVVKELPERLRTMPLPRGKGRGHGEMRGQGRGGRGKGRGSGGKPRLNVEKEVGSDNEEVGGDEE